MRGCKLDWQTSIFRKIQANPNLPISNRVDRGCSSLPTLPTHYFSSRTDWLHGR